MGVSETYSVIFFWHSRFFADNMLCACILHMMRIDLTYVNSILFLVSLCKRVEIPKLTSYFCVFRICECFEDHQEHRYHLQGDV